MFGWLFRYFETILREEFENECNENYDVLVIKKMYCKNIKRKPTNIDEHLREREEEAPRGSRSQLSRVNWRDHQRVADADAGYEAANHKKGVVGGQAHKQGADEEYGSGEDYGEAAAYPVGGAASHGGADEWVEAEDSHDHLFLYVGYFEVFLDVDYSSTHHSNICM